MNLSHLPPQERATDDVLQLLLSRFSTLAPAPADDFADAYTELEHLAGWVQTCAFVIDGVLQKDFIFREMDAVSKVELFGKWPGDIKPDADPAGRDFATLVVAAQDGDEAGCAAILCHGVGVDRMLTVAPSRTLRLIRTTAKFTNNPLYRVVQLAARRGRPLVDLSLAVQRSNVLNDLDRQFDDH